MNLLVLIGVFFFFNFTAKPAIFDVNNRISTVFVFLLLESCCVCVFYRRFAVRVGWQCKTARSSTVTVLENAVGLST
jgi:hypothetical protein